MYSSSRTVKLPILDLIEKETNYVGFEFYDMKFLDGSVSEIKDEFGDNFLVSTDETLVSDEIKVLLGVRNPFYHILLDTLAVILKINEENQDKDIRFVLYVTDDLDPFKEKKIIEFLIEQLSALKIKYTEIKLVPDSKLSPALKMNNYVKLDRNFGFGSYVSLPDMKRLSSFCRDIVHLPDDHEGTIKAYLTRSHMSPKIFNIGENHIGYKDDVRMPDEWKIEKYLKSIGFEIIKPEEEFDNFYGQIRYMANVKTLVSLTSSGLMNMLFMDEGQTVVEIQAELVTQKGRDDTDQSLFGLYSSFSFSNNLNYIGVPSNRDPDQVIKALKKLNL